MKEPLRSSLSFAGECHSNYTKIPTKLQSWGSPELFGSIPGETEKLQAFLSALFVEYPLLEALGKPEPGTLQIIGLSPCLVVDSARKGHSGHTFFLWVIPGASDLWCFARVFDGFPDPWKEWKESDRCNSLRSLKRVGLERIRTRKPRLAIRKLAPGPAWHCAGHPGRRGAGGPVQGLGEDGGGAFAYATGGPF